MEEETNNVTGGIEAPDGLVRRVQHLHAWIDSEPTKRESNAGRNRIGAEWSTHQWLSPV